MNKLDHLLAITIPLILIPNLAFVFSYFSKELGKEAGYLLGFLVYWIFGCICIPWALLGTTKFIELWTRVTPLLTPPNWAAAVLLAVITLVTLLTYGRDFLHAPANTILLAIPLATINGFCKELLWRGMYIRVFPESVGWAIVYPAFGFALWHLAPLQVFPVENKLAFIASTFFLGLAYGWTAYATGSIFWTALSHSLNGILALSGMLAPCALTFLPSKGR